MIKRELIKETAKATGYNQLDVKEIINEALEQIKQELKQGRNVNINEFGKFYITKYPGRTIRTPRGEIVKSNPSIVPRFKAGKCFKDYCNNRQS